MCAEDVFRMYEWVEVWMDLGTVWQLTSEET